MDTSSIVSPDDRPVLFSLAYEGERGAVETLVRRLCSFAQGAGFKSVSPVLSLTGDQVFPIGNQEQDPLFRLKVEAVIKLKIGMKAIGVAPDEIIAFSCVLANGEELNIGLCHYPATVQLPSTGEFIEVFPTTKWGWQSSVKIFNARSASRKISQLSDVSLSSLLAHAKAAGMFVEISLPRGHAGSSSAAVRV